MHDGSIWLLVMKKAHNLGHFGHDKKYCFVKE